MMSPSISLPFRRSCGRDEKVAGSIYCGDGLLGCLDDEVRVSCVGGEGRISSMASKVCIDKGMCKSWTVG